MACSIIRDKESGKLVQVLAPNGEPSLLFNNALKAFSNDETKALRAWAVAYTPSFKMKYGDWEKGESFINLDQNGEPTAEMILYTPAQIQKTINTDFARWEEFQTGSDGWVSEEKAIRFRSVMLSKFPDMSIDIMKNASMPGQAKLVFNTSFKSRDVKFTKDQIAEQQRTVNLVLDKLMTKFPGLTYEWVTAQSLKQSEHYFPIGSVRAYVKNNKIYLVKGRVTPEEAIEEVMHVFVEALRQDRPQLFKGLFDNTVDDPKYAADYVNLRNWYKENYKGEGLDTLIKSEFLAKTLAKALKSEMEINPDGRPVSALGKLLKRFLDWLASVFNAPGIIPGQAIKDIAGFINSREIEINLPVNEYLYYSADMSAGFETDDREYIDSVSPKFKGKSIKELNLIKAREEIKKLEKVKAFMVGATAEQKRVVDIYIQNVQDKIKALEEDEITIGVSKYKGQTTLDPKYNRISELGAGFGSFLHILIEDLQNDYMETKKSPFAVYTREWFDKFYNRNKEQIKFKDMNPDALYNIGLELTGFINGYVMEGKMLLPEIALAVRDVEGQLVIGRLDLIAIDPTGAVEIIDLKTKKIGLLAQGKFSDAEFQVGNYKSNWVTEPAAELKEITNRSAINEYQMQLNVYAEMNRLLGIPVSNRTIIAVAYSYDANNTNLAEADEFTFGSFAVGKIGDANFYKYDSSGRITISEGGIIDRAVKARFNPTAEEEQVSEDPKNNPFALINDVDQNKMMERLLELAKEQLNELTSRVKEVEKNTEIDINTQNEMIAVLRSRMAGIIKVKEALEKDKLFGETPESVALAKATIIKSALDTFNLEIKNVSDKIKSIDLPKTYQINSEEHRRALREVSGYITNLDSLRKYIDAFRNTINSLGIEEASRAQIVSVFDNMLSTIDSTRASYQNVTRGVVKAIIDKTMGKKKFAEVFGSIHQMIKPKLDYIERTIAAYERGNSQEARNLLYKIGTSITNVVLGNKNDPDRIEALKKEAVRLRQLMEINELNDKTIDDYLDGVINNQDSAFYIGSTMSGNKNIADMSDIIGSNADSEMIVNVMYQYMRNVTENGRREYLNWANQLDIDALKSAFIQAAGGINEANAMITEQQEVAKEFDKDGNVVNSDVHNFYVRPHTAEVEETYNSYMFRLNLYNEQIGELGKQIRESAEGPEKQQLIEQRRALYKGQNDLSTEFTEWQIEKLNTKVRPEILRLMKGSGTFNKEVSDLYDEIGKIINNAGGEQYLNDIDQEKIDEFEAKISEIRQKALESSPEDFQTLEELMKNFDYQLNINLWVIKREEIRRQGGEEMLKRWDRNNTDKMPTEEWQDTLQNLYKQRAAIYGSNLEIEELIKRRSKIKARAKVRGVYNYYYLTEQDVKELEDIDVQMEKLTSGPKPDLSEADILRVRSINNQIAAMSKKDVLPEYKEKLRTLHKNVRTAYNLYRDAKSKLNTNSTLQEIEHVTGLEKQYFQAEQTFANFYNKYNNGTYVVGQNIIASGQPVPDKPKSFLIKVMPKNPNDYELVPNKKYRYKRLKDAAYNPDYQESFVKSRFGGGMMPMPKGIKFNTVTKQFEVDPNSKNVNPKFLELQKNKTAIEFYNKWVIENFLLKQKQASGRPLGFNLPFVQQLGLENVISKGVSGLSREYKEKVQELMYGGSKFEKATNESGMVGSERVKFKENTAMPAELTTTNGIEAIVNWNAGFFANRELAGISVEITAVEEFLQDLINRISAGVTDPVLKSQKMRQIENIKDLVTFNKQKFIYGQVWEKETNPNKWLNRKTLRIIMQAASFGRMAFDIPMQVGNMLSGNVQAFIAMAGSKHANSDDFAAAKKLLYTRFFPRLLADYGKQSGLSYETMLYQFMNPLSRTLDRMMDANTVSKLRRVANRVFNITDLAMVLQDKGEMEIGLSMMLAIMHNRKYKVFEVDQDGNPLVVNGEKVVKKNADGSEVTVTAVDAFAFNNGQFGLRKDVDISQKEIEDLQGLIMLEIYHSQGNYAGYTKTKVGSTMLGSLFEFYRKYLIPAVSNRFAFGETSGVGSAYAWESGDAHMGYYVALMKSAQYYGLGTTAKNLLYDTFLPGLVQRKFGIEIDTQDYYRGKSAKAGREILLAIAFYTIYQALRASLYDDDEEDLSYAELMMFRSLVKVSNETRSMTPVPIVGKPGDYIEQFGTFTTAFREGETMWNMINNALFYASYQTTGSEFAYERGFYQRDTDRYEEGDPKIWKNLSDLSGWSNIKDAMTAEGALTAAKAATKLK